MKPPGVRPTTSEDQLRVAVSRARMSVGKGDREARHAAVAGFDLKMFAGPRCARAS